MAFMSEDQPATRGPARDLDSLVKIAHSVFKRLEECTEEEVLLARSGAGGQIEREMRTVLV